MKNVINVMWVDDEWFSDSDGKSVNGQFSEWEEAWRSKLLLAEIDLHVDRSASPDIIDKVLRSNKFDALILDYGLKGDRGTYGNSLELLDVMRRVPDAAKIPAIIFSKLPAGDLDHIKHPQLHGVFVKNSSGVDSVGCFLESLAKPRELNFLLLSDLHVGYLPLQGIGSGTLHHDRFFRSLTDHISSISKIEKIDAVIISGDFAWHSPSQDMDLAALTVGQIARAANVNINDAVLFCPGNHDICYDKSDNGDWSAFQIFVDRLAIGAGDEFKKRFVMSWHDIKRRLKFDTQDSLLSVVRNDAARFVFVGINSCAPTGGKYVCEGVVDGSQWDYIGAHLKNVPDTYLRIGALHHPIFASPDGFWKPDFPITNQGSALEYLAKHGFSVVVHGHAHFSGVRYHQAHAINRPGSKHLNRTVDPGLLVVSCPSVLADPDPNTPNRQFFLAKFRQQLKSGARLGWDFGLTSHVFEPSSCTWQQGDELPVGAMNFVQRGKFSS